MTDDLKSSINDDRNILPHVGQDHGNRPMWIGLGAIGLFGLFLFAQLEASRHTTSAPSVSPRIIDHANIGYAAPQLYIPDDVVSDPIPLFTTKSEQPSPETPVQLKIIPQPQAPITKQNIVTNYPSNSYTPPLYAPPATTPILLPEPHNNSPVIIYESGQNMASNTEQASGSAQAQSPRTIHASSALNRDAHIMQGTLIMAVLENGIDSTHAGQVRALVSRNIFDRQSKNILIPRGSRLFGEYSGDIASGQNRAFVLWSRLVRPDGVTISLDSPATDRLGRAGIKGSVDSHFFERLGNALLQSTIDIGSLVASRAISSNSVVVAVPATAQSAASQLVPATPKPTLNVKPGTSISVLVSHDIDFTGVMDAQ